jgi:hypothetical protein
MTFSPDTEECDACIQFAGSEKGTGTDFKINIRLLVPIVRYRIIPHLESEPRDQVHA